MIDAVDVRPLIERSGARRPSPREIADYVGAIVAERVRHAVQSEIETSPRWSWLRDELPRDRNGLFPDSDVIGLRTFFPNKLVEFEGPYVERIETAASAIVERAPMLPRPVIVEALLNAIVHRALEGQIHVRVLVVDYQDVWGHVEIANYCADHLDVRAAALGMQHLRHPTLYAALRQAFPERAPGLIGIARALRNAGLPPPAVAVSRREFRLLLPTREDSRMLDGIEVHVPE